MKTPIRNLRLVALAAAIVSTVTALSSCGGNAQAQVTPFTLISPELLNGTFDNKFVLNGFGCTGNNVSPSLIWSGVPAGTASFAL